MKTLALILAIFSASYAWSAGSIDVRGSLAGEIIRELEDAGAKFRPSGEGRELEARQLTCTKTIASQACAIDDAIGGEVLKLHVGEAGRFLAVLKEAGVPPTMPSAFPIWRYRMKCWQSTAEDSTQAECIFTAIVD